MKLFNSEFAVPLKLDLGCGAFKREGYIGIDNYVSEEQWKDHATSIDINWDLSKGIPFEDASVAAVYTSHYLEHTNIDFLLREIHRVAQPDAAIHIVVPYANSAEGMYPGHVNFLTEKFFNNNTCFQERFRDVEYRFDPTPEWTSGLLQKHLDIPFDVARVFLFNVCWQMHILCKPRR
jgi:predicted SAM-dependent methyltransferase